VYCDDTAEFALDVPVQIHGHDCKILSKTPYDITVKPSSTREITSEEVEVSQQKVTADPRAILDLLKNYWTPCWHTDQPASQCSDAFEQFLQRLPQNLPAPAVDLEDDRLWFEAVAYLKAPSARGADAISTSELEQLPKLAITHVKNIIVNFQHGFPSWFMLALTVPIPKIQTTPTPAEFFLSRSCHNCIDYGHLWFAFSF
jgi:hypothetical protein